MKITTFTSVQPNGVKRVTTLSSIDGWIRKSHKYTAPTLQEISRQKINAILKTDNHIERLPIPRILQQDLAKHYLNDKLCCNEVEIEYMETNNFDEPFLNIGRDGRLYYQQCFYIPAFVYERNLVNHIYYTLHRDDIPHEYVSKLCHECVYRLAGNGVKWSHIEYWCEEDIIRGENFIDEVLQVDSMWCSSCKTTSLFYIQDYDDDSSMPMRYFHRQHLLRRIPL